MSIVTQGSRFDQIVCQMLAHLAQYFGIGHFTILLAQQDADGRWHVQISLKVAGNNIMVSAVIWEDKPITDSCNSIYVTSIGGRVFPLSSRGCNRAAAVKGALCHYRGIKGLASFQGLGVEVEGPELLRNLFPYGSGATNQSNENNPVYRVIITQRGESTAYFVNFSTGEVLLTVNWEPARVWPRHAES